MTKRFYFKDNIICLCSRNIWEDSEFKTIDLGISMYRKKGILTSRKGRSLNSYFIGINLLVFKFWIYFTL